jgi:hypothetical protein
MWPIGRSLGTRVAETGGQNNCCDTHNIGPTLSVMRCKAVGEGSSLWQGIHGPHKELVDLWDCARAEKKLYLLKDRTVMADVAWVS